MPGTAAEAPSAGHRVDVIAGQVVPPEPEPKQQPVALVTHPLDPLTPAEIVAAAEIVRKHAGFDMRFDVIELLEPPKADVRGWSPGAAWTRLARTTSFKRTELGAYRAHVDLAAGKVLHWDHVPGVRPMIQFEDMVIILKVCLQSKELADALAKRGLKVEERLLHIEPWPIGCAAGMPAEQIDGKSPLLCYIWERLYNTDNHYAHPVEGLHIVFDRLSNTILEVHDRFVEPVPKEPVNYRPEEHTQSLGSYSFKPLVISQPEGVSFTLDNRLLRWHKWQLHVGFSFREGTILSDIRFDGRSVCYDARIAEMVVPYGGIQGPHARKNVFDIGEVGFGVNANELQLGCDCKGSIEYLDAWIPTSDGKARCIRNAICIHEEDAGMLWKHSDFRGPPEVRRARRLAVSSVHTVGNYEYACYWYFMMDGVIEFEMKATGIINTTGRQSECEKFGTEVSPGVWGHIHQHMFCAKLDMAVDGDANAVVECDTVREPMGSAGNPLGNAFYLQESTLLSEQQACRTRNDETMRFWKFINPNVKNGNGRPVGYRLEPVHSVRPFAWPESETGMRMAIFYKDLWVTPYSREERYPAGEFMHQSMGEDGLPRWTKADRPVANTDIVAWYNFGLHHVTRPEDWPVQPCVSTGFMLHPAGFFDRNPCLDVPPEHDRHSADAKAGAPCH
uniref:Amine oxidase n=1 Tax=Alexandrium monilatum TaxID=311494 RepID=A0A7S4VYK0_9DINO